MTIEIEADGPSVIVVDASVALAWTLPDTEANHRFAADVLELQAAGYTLVVPGSVFTAEVSFVLLKYGRRVKEGEAMMGERAEFIEQFIDQEYQLTTRVPTLVSYAVRHNVQGYDAVYLGLAQYLGAWLATLDLGLRTAARERGLWLLA